MHHIHISVKKMILGFFLSRSFCSPIYHYREDISVLKLKWKPSKFSSTHCSTHCSLSLSRLAEAMVYNTTKKLQVVLSDYIA